MIPSIVVDPLRIEASDTRIAKLTSEFWDIGDNLLLLRCLMLLLPTCRDYYNLSDIHLLQFAVIRNPSGS